MRQYLIALGLVAAMTAPLAARADTYSLLLTSTNDGGGGTGSFSITGAPPTTGTETYTQGDGLTALNFTLDGLNFSLSNDVLDTASVVFDNGSVEDISYSGDLFSLSPFSLDLLGTGLSPCVTAPCPTTIFYSLAGSSANPPTVTDDQGYIDVVPEPSTLALLGSGLLGLAFMLRRKLRNGESAPAWDSLAG